MASITTLIKKNKFGCSTYYINLETLFRIEINQANNGTYIVEFKELGIVWNTSLFSFTSNKPILEIVSEAMDRVADFYRNSPKYNVPEHIYVKDKKEIMSQAIEVFK